MEGRLSEPSSAALQGFLGGLQVPDNRDANLVASHDREHTARMQVSVGMAEDVEVPLWDADYRSYIEEHRRFFDRVAAHWDRWRRRNGGYHQQIRDQYRYLIAPEARVLEVGCATGELLAGLKPREGIGVDISPEMVDLARRKFPDANLTFIASPIEEWDPQGRQFDYIVLSDVVGLLRDIELVLHRLRECSHPRTRLILNFHSHLWLPIFTLAEKLKLKAPAPRVNWVTREDIASLLHLAGFEPIGGFSRVLIPKHVPFLAAPLNRLLARLVPGKWFCMSNFVVARVPLAPFERPPRVSVVCPCRNEAGNIPAIVQRLPEMGAGTELIFVEGGSRDGTYQRCLEAQMSRMGVDIRVYQQQGKGKGDAVRLGFAQATGDILMILDADLTVPPEDLPRFYRALAHGTAEFVNGSRLVYPMKTGAMRFLNLCGNKFFAWVFSTILEQNVKDTLCGTKALIRSDYERIAAARTYFGRLDPFGDFDLLFGAAKLGLKIQDVPVIYRDRAYGTTNIHRFRHGWLLLKMAALGFWRIKCR
jgi:ubiquinone/menaquinone biosynthesis C-methylase UbiE